MGTRTRSTSIVYKMPADKPVSAHAVFSDLDAPGSSSSPEFYPRPDGTVYICGDHTDPGRTAPLPATAKDVVPSDYAIKNLQVLARFMSSHFDDATVEVTQACFKPESLTGQPIVGKLAPGLWVAGGHSVWGITQGTSCACPFCGLMNISDKVLGLGSAWSVTAPPIDLLLTLM